MCKNILENFLDNDQSLAPAVLRYLLLHWPHLNMHKEVLFLTKVLRVLRRVCGGKNTPLFMRPMMDPCLRMVAHCLTSPHHLVANRALSFLGIEVTFQNPVSALTVRGCVAAQSRHRTSRSGFGSSRQIWTTHEVTLLHSCNLDTTCTHRLVRHRYRAQECDCVVVHDEPPVPMRSPAHSFWIDIKIFLK